MMRDCDDEISLIRIKRVLRRTGVIKYAKVY